MQTKDRLLAAARTCLLSNGYAGTSVRDLIAESGTNQASINYHYGSKDALLTHALLDLNGTWGEHLFGALASSSETAEHQWQRVLDSIRANSQLWFLNFEAVALAQHNHEIRAGLAERIPLTFRALVTAFGRPGDAPGTNPPEDANPIGSVYYSLLIGAAVQLITDPDHAPTASQLAAITTNAYGAASAGHLGT